jgi:hypothetical protein
MGRGTQAEARLTFRSAEQVRASTLQVKKPPEWEIRRLLVAADCQRISGCWRLLFLGVEAVRLGLCGGVEVGGGVGAVVAQVDVIVGSKVIGVGVGAQLVIGRRWRESEAILLQGVVPRHGPWFLMRRGR